jgi:hypothetical protein
MIFSLPNPLNLRADTRGQGEGDQLGRQCFASCSAYARSPLEAGARQVTSSKPQFLPL